ncbi:MAG: FG-GAP-like repeat-containing protein [Salibacteraceae bacterium]
MKNLLLAFTLIFATFGISAQNSVNVSTTVPQELTVCSEAESFGIKIMNNSNNTLTNLSMELQLPTGIEYLPNSLAESTNKNVQQQNSTSLVFSANNLAIGDSIIFEVDLKAVVSSINYQQLGNIFRNQVKVNYNSTAKTHTSNAYNVLYAALNITQISPKNQTMISGDTITRAIKVVNAGNGKIASFELSDIRTVVGVDLVASDVGQLNTTLDTITLSGADFTSIGNGDAFFDKNESITITQTLVANGCNAVTVSSALNTIWGCLGEERVSSTTYGNVSINLKNPSLSISSKASLSSCFASEKSAQEITLINNGQGYAANVTVDIFKSSGGSYNQDLFSALDESSFTYQIESNGTPISITPITYATRNDGAYSCLGSSPIGRAIITLPQSIAPGATVIIKWETKHCCINECNNEQLMGWKYKVDYADVCGNSSYSKTNTGEGATELNMTVFTETPTDIKSGETLPYNYIISSHDNNLPVGPGAQYKVTIALPQGLKWTGNSTDIKWTSSPNDWAPSSIAYNTTTNELVGTFKLNAPFVIQKSELTVNLTGDCSNGVSGGTKTIDFSIDYIPDTTCNSCQVAMICSKTTTTDLHCPLLNCEGLRFLAFDAKRSNFGAPDNDANGLADANGSIDANKIKTNRIMFGDTLQTTYIVVVDTGANNNRFYNFFVEADIELGQNLSLIGGNLKIHDDATNNYYNCSNFSTSIVNSTNTSRKFRHSFLPNINCGNLPNTPGYNGFYFTHGDSIEFTVSYKVTGNIGGDVQEIKIDNDLFTSSLSSPWTASSAALNNDKWACDDFDGRVTLIGYYFENTGPNNYTVSSCSRVVRQDYRLSIGDCCDNFAGGNLFPYEYRNWGHVKTVEVTIPTKYIVEEVYFNQKRTKATNTLSTSTIRNLIPFHNSGGKMVFNLEQHYKEYGGSIDKSDDGFRGTVTVVLAPTCDVPTNTYEDINWRFQFEKSATLGSGTTNWYTSNPDRIRYNPTNLVLSSNNPIEDGLGRTVSWNLNVKNNTSNSSAGNAWIHFKSPSNGVEILHVIENSTGDTIPMISDYYKLETINASSTKSYTVVATYSGCSPEQIVVYSGYECAGYPTEFATFRCSYTTLALKVEPKTAEPQVTISGKTIGGTCSSTIEVTMEVASVKFAHVDSIAIAINSIGNTLNFISGSGELKYPLSGSFISIADPTSVSTYNKLYKLADLNEEIKNNALPGVLDLDNNRFQLRFKMQMASNFSPGDFAELVTTSQGICGSQLPTISLAYDPSVQFNVNTAAGLSNDKSDSWGMSWGDYDNDGFDDLYVAEYDVNKPSYLYHNNGDGTFSKNTSGVVVSDKGSSIAGTWGDYNNDGLLDLFVANNVGALNALYKNNGGGNFTKITTGDIANHSGYCHGASWVDYNGDGYLDLFVTDYMPTKFNLLYKNNQNGTFTKITNSELVQEAKYTIGATWADYDMDGDMDVFVPATNGQPNSLFRNNGNGDFEKMDNVGIPIDSANSVGCSWGDFDNDMDLDLFVTNTSGQNNFLYQNDGDGTFTQVTSGIIVNDGGLSSSSNWVDFDNDGDLDIYVCNDQSDANVMYINDGNGNFTKPTSPLSENLGNSYSHAWSDYDNDGDMDLIVGNHSSENNVFFQNNRANCNAWACIKLIGVNSNFNAIGAQIKVKANIYGQNTWQMKEVSAQTGGGAGSQNSLKALFGLGDASSIDSIVVIWPSGYRQVLTNESVNDCINIQEGTGIQVCGNIYNDANEDCIQGADEQGIPGLLVKVSPGERFTTTDENGNYQFYLEAGTYTISHAAEGNWSSTCNSNGISKTIVTGQTYCGNNFGIKSSCTDADLSVTLGTTALRRGFQNEYSVVYKNLGVFDAYDVELSITLDNEIIPISSSIPWNNSVDYGSISTYTWILDTVGALSTTHLTLVDSVDLNAINGTLLTVSALITDYSNDCDTNDNRFTDVNPIVGAIDPNDITVYPIGEGNEGYIEKSQNLTYKIRFQNVGTYFAQNVIITNELPNGIDLNTLSNITSSHEFKMELKGNQVMFTFENIMLPDSGRDEKASNGFISFNVIPIADVSSGELIPNQAEIVFDYEAPLATNKVLNTIKFNTGSDNNLILQPNPTSDYTNISLEFNHYRYSVPSGISSLKIYSLTGTIISSVNYELLEQSIKLDCTKLSPGTYIVVIQDHTETRFTGRLIVN